MKNKKLLAIITVLLFSLVIAASASAQKEIIISGNEHRNLLDFDIISLGATYDSDLICITENYYDELDLTNEQKRKLRALKRKAKKASITLNADMSILRLDLNDLYDDVVANRNEIEQSYKKLYDLKLKSSMAKLDQKVEIDKILTKEQKETLKDLKTENRGLISFFSKDRDNRIYFKKFGNSKYEKELKEYERQLRKKYKK